MFMNTKRVRRSAGLITLLLTIAVGAVIIGGCGTTQQSNLWVDPSYRPVQMKKILVVAMRKDQLKRRMWEDAVVEAFDNKAYAGTVAVASYQLFPDDLPDTQAVRIRMKAENYDGILLVAPVQRDTLTNQVAGYMTNEQVTRYSRRWNTYMTHYEDVYHPGYTEMETAISVRTDLLVPREDGKMVWSVTSQSVDPTSPDQFRSSVGDRIASQLKREGFIY
jgi:hypothetical protein